MIEIKNLTKTYAKSAVKAVDDLTLTVRSGEIYGFLGPNGAGKSTTIKCLTGILPFSEGSINICGVNLKDAPVEAKTHIGFVPDEHVLYESLTGFQYVEFIADVFNVDAEKRKELLEKYASSFEMSDKLQDKISSYSHGMKQKISIISALIHEPDVLILDEPMTGLDPKSSFELKQIMKEYAESGKTVFFSSHVLEVVEKICTTIAIINKGKLVTEFKTNELQDKKADMDLEELFLKLTSDGEGNE